jgi:predicted membrane metal-binding protein
VNLELYGSAVLAVVSLASMWLISRKQASGWAVAIAAQALWVPYDVLTHQLPFIAVTVVSVPVYFRGWRRFRDHDS